MADFRKRGRNWYYRFINSDGRRVERRGCPDLGMTKRMAHEAESRAAMERAGLVDAKAERMAGAERKPILDHLGDFIDSLTAKGDDPKHIALTRTYATRVVELAKVERVSELSPSAVARALASLK